MQAASDVHFFALPQCSIICHREIVLLGVWFHWVVAQEIIFGGHWRRVGCVRRLINASGVFCRPRNRIVGLGVDMELSGTHTFQASELLNKHVHTSDSGPCSRNSARRKIQQETRQEAQSRRLKHRRTRASFRSSHFFQTSYKGLGNARSKKLC